MHSGAKQLISARQAEIADLVASGKSNREIAETLFLSPRTVETHVAALFDKLSVRSRTELVAAVLRQTEGNAFATPRAARTNLPLQLNNLIGRACDVSQIASTLLRERLVTVTGTGGVGKTRTALQIGAEVGQGCNDGVWLVELAPVGNTSLVAATASALGIQELPGRPLLESLLAYLKKKKLLLILDNCEHVIAEAATLADTILKTCPGVRILATSREPLKIRGEYSYRLPSLRMPTLSAARSLNAAEASAYDAIVLFAERAKASDGRFALDDDNAPIVAEICLRLDGIPLAIELAASRVKIVSVAALSKNLDRRFHILSQGERTALPRHRTMRALMDWSYELLSPSERRLFDYLSVFAGGCVLAAVTAVYKSQSVHVTDASANGQRAAADETGELTILELLGSLVDKSLVVADVDGREPRYRLLESSRQYAHEKLAARGEEVLVAHCHARAYLQLAERLQREWDTSPDRAWLAQSEVELENWRAALEWALDARSDVVLGQRLAGALQPVWTQLAYAEGRRWLRLALDRVSETTPPSVVAQLAFGEAAMALASNSWDAALCAGEWALTVYRSVADRLGIARTQHVLGTSLLYHDGRIAESEALLREALETLREFGPGRYVGFSLARIAYLRSRERDLAAARALYAEALSIFKALGAERGAAIVGSNLAEVEFLAGDPRAALRLATDALTIYRALKYDTIVTQALVNIAGYFVALAEYDAARAHAREALERAREQKLEVIVVWALQHLAAIAALRPHREVERTFAMRAARRGTQQARSAVYLDEVRADDHDEDPQMSLYL